MSTAHYYREPCALCGKTFSKREMNKLLMEASHLSCTHPKKVCFVCDNCLPTLLDYLGVPEPEAAAHRPPTRWCRKCYNNVGQRARFCPYCGDELLKQEKAQKGRVQP